jgi:glycosyltransferase involved in cell wall biosynthesis
MPSAEEPFGRVAIEAMACGAAVLATDRGGPTEYIENGKNGILLPPRNVPAWAEALRGILSDGTRLDRIVSGGRETSLNRFGPRSDETSMLGVYRAVLGVLGS